MLVLQPGICILFDKSVVVSVTTTQKALARLQSRDPTALLGSLPSVARLRCLEGRGSRSRTRPFSPPGTATGLPSPGSRVPHRVRAALPATNRARAADAAEHREAASATPREGRTARRACGEEVGEDEVWWVGLKGAGPVGDGGRRKHWSGERSEPRSAQRGPRAERAGGFLRDDRHSTMCFIATQCNTSIWLNIFYSDCNSYGVMYSHPE